MVMRVSADKAIVIGVTDQTITHLADVDLPSNETPQRREQIDELSGISTGDALRGLGIDALDFPIDYAKIENETASPLAGSILSPGTWRAARLALTERTVRR